MKYEPTKSKRFYAPQFNALCYANQNAVLSGCEVTPSTPAAMTVEVSAGRIFYANDIFDVSADTLTINTNATSFNRIDMIAVDNTSTLSVIEGTAAELAVPADYDPDVYIILGLIFVSPTTTSITSSLIKDNRVLNLGGGSSGGGSGFSRKVEAFTSQTSVTVTHNLGDNEPMVFVYDDTDELIQPDTITIVDANSVTVTFSAATTGKIIIFGGVALNNGYYKTTFTSQTSVTVTHNLQNKYVNVMVYNSSDELIEPQTVTLVDDSSCTVTFGASTTGTIVVTGGVSSENYIQNMTINPQTTAYQLIQDDNNSMIKCTGTFTVTLPNGLSTGFQCVIMNYGTGTITFSAAGTLRSKNSFVLLASQYSCATAVHLGSNEWIIFGDLS